ncbi:TRAP transporter permease [Falsiroseomonas sp.]|uniref:TRAP transporter permease n=1 Tax=Falsiroseomonas sp. TaxID=2870721 RepID=UPI0035613DFB
MTGAAGARQDAAARAAAVDDSPARPFALLPPRWQVLVGVIAVAFSAFHLYTATFGVLEGIRQRVVHLGFALVLAFLLRPTWGGPRSLGRLLDAVFIGFVVAGCTYLFIEDEQLDARMGLVFTSDIVLGIGVTLALLEATRRLTGIALPLIAVIAIGFAYFGPWLPGALAHRGFGVDDITVTLFLTTEGIFGPPLAVSATYIVLFIILGAVLQESGAGRFFSDLAYSLFGRVRGGPAKVAVVGSSLFGMISGSAVANVTGTGVLTIPLMRRIGFSRTFAGAVEAVASTGGQMMPPIMASAAFIIAEVLGIAYLDVAAGAAIPALLYYAAVFVAVDLHAARLGMRGQSRAELPQALRVLRQGGHLLLVPLALVLLMAVGGFSPMRAAVLTILVNLVLFVLGALATAPRGARPGAVAGILAVHALGYAGLEALGPQAGLAIYAVGLALLWLRGRRAAAGTGPRLTAELTMRVVRALRDGALGTLEVAACCATAGIIIGVFMLTGLGLRLSGLLVDAAGNNLALLLVLTMVASLILGMGVPTIGAYIILAVLVAPGLIQLGVDPLAAHLFIFYFGVISCITPPVALAAYAAAAISGASPMRTGLVACRLGFAAYIIPFMMVYNPELLLRGDWSAIIGASLTALVGASCIAAAFEGFWLARMRGWERVLLGAAGLGLIKPGLVTDAVGALLVTAVLVAQLRSRAAPGAAPAPALPSSATEQP